MGTRGIMGVRIDGHDKLTYNHFDSYPSGLGDDMVKDVRKLLQDPGIEGLKTKARELRMVDQDSKPTEADIQKLEPYADTRVSGGRKDEWYVLLRNLQGKLADTLFAGVAIDSHDFVKDSLFCEWGYVVNLDNNTFEVYEGFQTKPHAKGRYSLLPVKENRQDPYCPIALVAVIPFSELDEKWAAVRDGGEEPAPPAPTFTIGGDPFTIE